MSSSSASAENLLIVKMGEERGIPTHCYCDLRAVIMTYRYSTDQGRQVYSCKNALLPGDEECHVFKWFDESVEEEFGEINNVLRHLKLRIDKLEALADRTTTGQQMEAQSATSTVHEVVKIVGVLGVLLGAAALLYQ